MSVLCFWTDEVRSGGKLRHAAGPAAIEAYLDDPLDSRLIMSMKTYLAQASFTETKVFAVENMTCELCPLTVRTAMERVPGVTLVVVDFDAKTATVTFDPAAVTIDAIAAASANVGYPAHVAGARKVHDQQHL